VVGGPGSGKGILCSRLAKECGVVHLSSGDLLRHEVSRGTPLGLACAEIMKRGELVSSAVITALVRRHMRSFPGRRVLLDGFPRSLQNAYDFVELCGKPELALHLDCDDTVLLERIIKRKHQNQGGGQQRADDDVDIALRRLRTFHKYHKPTIDWLREIHVPVVNLDCSGTPENVWEQLLAIGRLMRPAAQFRENIVKNDHDDEKSLLVGIQGLTA
jgi:adenylate kinase family enzyme